MKKIALCLYGRYNNRMAPKKSGDDGFIYIQEKILKSKSIDVFIFSWDTELETKICDKYNIYLKASLFEKQKDFGNIIKANNIDETIFINSNRQYFRTVSNSLSFFYSRMKSIELKKEYEKENNFKYDCCIVCRFDLGQIDKYNGYQPYKVSEINFNENFDMSYIYSAMWNQLNTGYADQWFYSNSKNIDLLGDMYNKAQEYFKPESSYIKALTDGWPDSNADDEFSNEYFKSKEFRSTNLVKFKTEEAVNNHFMHKWFFIDTGLYEISRFV